MDAKDDDGICTENNDVIVEKFDVNQREKYVMVH
jgi:hypothetical protein